MKHIIKKLAMPFLCVTLFWCSFFPRGIFPVHEKAMLLHKPTISANSNQRFWVIDDENNRKHMIGCAFIKNMENTSFCDLTFRRNIELESVNLTYLDTISPFGSVGMPSFIVHKIQYKQDNQPEIKVFETPASLLNDYRNLVAFDKQTAWFYLALSYLAACLTLLKPYQIRLFFMNLAFKWEQWRGK